MDDGQGPGGGGCVDLVGVAGGVVRVEGVFIVSWEWLIGMWSVGDVVGVGVRRPSDVSVWRCRSGLLDVVVVGLERVGWVSQADCCTLAVQRHSDAVSVDGVSGYVDQCARVVVYELVGDDKCVAVG